VGVGRPGARARRAWSAGASGLERGRVGPPAAPPRWPSCSASAVSDGSMDMSWDALAGQPPFSPPPDPVLLDRETGGTSVGGEEGSVCSGGQRRPLRRWSAPYAVGGGRWGWRNKGGRETGEVRV
jgi:hypothetical protein